MHNVIVKLEKRDFNQNQFQVSNVRFVYDYLA